MAKQRKQLDAVKALNAVFNPRSVAVIGASADPKSVGFGVLKSLAEGCVFDSPYCKPFLGKVYAVNPNHAEILGIKCVASVKQVESPIDVAVLCIPARIVLQVARECGEKGVKALIVITAGFSEIGGEGAKLQQALLDLCGEFGMRMIGPNCLGVVRTSHNLNASFALSVPPAGGVAFISQSGALADSAIDWGIQERYAFSFLASIGNSADLDAADFVEWAGNDDETKVITLYLEGLARGRKFMEVARRVSKKKPILVIKAGKSNAGTAAAGSHTGSLAGDFKVFRGAMKQCGVFLVESIEELFDLAKTLAEQPRAKANSIGIVTNSGGPAVLAADYCDEFGVNLAKLDEKTIALLDASGVMHPAYSRKNPLDLVGDALPPRYRAGIFTLLEQEYISGLIVIQVVTTMTDSKANAQIILEARKKFPDKPILAVFMGGKFSAEGVKLLLKHGVPEFNDPRKAVQSMAALCGVL